MKICGICDFSTVSTPVEATSFASTINIKISSYYKIFT